MKEEMAGRDTPGEELALLILLILVVTGARTEVTEMVPLVVVLAMEGQAQAWTSPPSLFPPSSLLMD